MIHAEKVVVDELFERVAVAAAVKSGPCCVMDANADVGAKESTVQMKCRQWEGRPRKDLGRRGDFQL